MDMLPFFVQTLVTLADRIKSLKDGPINNRQQAFEKIIHPLYVDVDPVVKNYFVLFRKAKQLIKESSKADLGLAVQEIRDSRESTLQARKAVRGMVDQMQQIYDDKKIIDFARKVDSFFYRTVCERKIRGKSSAVELVDLFDAVARNDLDKTEIVSFIDLTLRSMDDSWDAITQSYSYLRIYCLSQPKDVKID